MIEPVKTRAFSLYRTAAKASPWLGFLLLLNSAQAAEVGIGLDGQTLRIPIEFKVPLRLEPRFGYTRQLPNSDPTPSDGSTTSTGLQIEYLHQRGNINWSIGAVFSHSYGVTHSGFSPSRTTSESLVSSRGMVLGAELIVTPNWRIGIENRLLRTVNEFRRAVDPIQPQQTDRTTSTQTEASLVIRYLI